MRNLWLIFTQTVTIAVAVVFVANTLSPSWLNGGQSAEIVTIVESPGTRNGDVTTQSVRGSYSDAAIKAMPAVVHVFASGAQERIHPLHDEPLLRDFFGEQRRTPPRSGLGSGVIVSPDGYVLTNNHVIEAAESIEIAMNDGRKYAATVVGRDPESDLAVLRIEDKEQLPAITFAGADELIVGDVVLAIGNPFGVGQTVTQGIVSATGRTQLGINTFEDYIQTDAAINPGNSGGALVDSAGNLVGINTAIFSRTGGSMGIGFAIPVSLARNVFEQIVTFGQVIRGWIGVEIQEVTTELVASFDLPSNEGALIAGVFRDSPAADGGIRPGDILIALDGSPIRDARQMLDRVSALPPGHTAQFKAWRNGKEIDVEVEISQRPARDGLQR